VASSLNQNSERHAADYRGHHGDPCRSSGETPESARDFFVAELRIESRFKPIRTDKRTEFWFIHRAHNTHFPRTE
jgi:hypothetical protein